MWSICNGHWRKLLLPPFYYRRKKRQPLNLSTRMRKNTFFLIHPDKREKRRCFSHLDWQIRRSAVFKKTCKNISHLWTQNSCPKCIKVCTIILWNCLPWFAPLKLRIESLWQCKGKFNYLMQTIASNHQLCPQQTSKCPIGVLTNIHLTKFP